LIVEHSVAPKADGPPKAREGRSGAAPGKLKTSDYESGEAEFERGRSLLKKGAGSKLCDSWKLVSGTEGMTTGPASDRALIALLNEAGIPGDELKLAGRETAVRSVSETVA